MFRRAIFTAPLLAGATSLLVRPGFADDPAGRLRQGIADLEYRHGGRLGVAMLDTANNRLVDYRGAERFAFCSVYKVLAAALVLARVDRRQENLARRITYTRAQLVDYSPVTLRHVASGLSMGEICAAALEMSDNTAANLMLESFGGPAALTGYLRACGDAVTRVDRQEPQVNEVGPGDPRDTTTPLAMLATLRKLLLGATLSAASRARLSAWMLACRTGEAQLRAGLPKSWRVADKTGSGPANVTNDVAVVWPPTRPPIVVTAFYTGTSASIDARHAVLSAVGGLAASI